MNISLKQEQEQFIQAKVESGKYATANEVITAALDLLAARDKQYQQWLIDTRQKVAVGLEKLDRGERIKAHTVINNLQTQLKIAKKEMK